MVVPLSLVLLSLDTIIQNLDPEILSGNSRNKYFTGFRWCIPLPTWPLTHPVARSPFLVSHRHIVRSSCLSLLTILLVCGAYFAFVHTCPHLLAHRRQ